MSYCRKSFCGLYIFDHVDGHIECCMCDLAPGAFDVFKARTPEEMIAHVKEHREAGHDVPDGLEEKILAGDGIC